MLLIILIGDMLKVDANERIGVDDALDVLNEDEARGLKRNHSSSSGEEDALKRTCGNN